MRGILALAIVVTAIAAGVTIAAGGVDLKPKKKEVAAATGGTAAAALQAATPPDTTAQATVGATVRMRSLAFKPVNVTIREGESVRWVNHDSVIHNVTATSGSGTEFPAFHSKSMPPRGTYEVVPRVGTYLYVCTIHPTVMHGRVTVTAS